MAKRNNIAGLHSNGTTLATKVIDQVIEGMRSLNEAIKTLEASNRQILTELARINTNTETLTKSMAESKKSSDEARNDITSLATLMTTINEQLARSPISAFIMESLRGFGGLMVQGPKSKGFSLVFWSIFVALTIWGVLMSRGCIAVSQATKEMKNVADAVISTADGMKKAATSSDRVIEYGPANESTD